ncbi:MAG: 4'-phosphopantetheinyl transferase superfamily protein [Thermonemataceae bacterium]|nr:4'-phosphopantetheinyl transferase superfamily protein [Thermonemataceae bacterium]
MPLHILHDTKNESVFAWKVEESEVFFSEKLLESEQEILKKIVLAKKRIEFAATRYLMALLSRQKNIDYEGIQKDFLNKPFLKNSLSNISISHSLPWVVVAWHSHKYIGVDIELEQEKLRKIAPRVFSEQEMQTCKDNLQLLTKFWCAKEVLYKIFGREIKDFRKNLVIKLVSEEVLSGFFINEEEKIEVQLLTKSLDEKYEICWGFNVL